MEKYPNVGYDIIPIGMPASAGEMEETSTYRTDKDHRRVIGLALTITDESALSGCKIGVSVDGQEILPKDFEAKMIWVDDGVVPPNDRFYYFGGIEVDESEIDVRWEDGSSGVAPGTGYTAKLYLMCTLKD